MGLNEAFNEFGRNEGDVFMVINFQTPEHVGSVSDLLGEYESLSGVTPEMPIVKREDGGYELAQISGFIGAGGPTWILHPDREYTETNYKQPDLNTNIQAAVDDDCIGAVSIASHGKKVSCQLADFKTIVTESGLIIHSNIHGFYEMSLRSISGKEIMKRNIRIHGKSFISTGYLLKGVYLITLKGNSALYKEKVVIK